MGGEEEVFGAREPADFRDGGVGDDVVFVDADVFLGVCFEPDDVSCRCAHYDIDMGRTFGEGIYVVAKHVGFGEEDLHQRLRLSKRSAN